MMDKLNYFAGSIKVLIGIFLANIITMLVLNTFVLANYFFIVVYLSALLFSAGLIRKAGLNLLPAPSSLDYLSDRDRNILWFFTIILSLLLIIPRASYFLEFLSQSVVYPVCDDDYWHIQELNSLINSGRYPAQSSFLAGKYLSFYYAPCLLAVFLYKLLPFNFVTIKFVLALADSLYIILIINSILVIILKISGSRNQLYLLIYLFFLHAGIESIGIFRTPLEHHEWWMSWVAGANVQISSFVTLAFWVIHHLSAALALVLAGLIFQALPAPSGRDRWAAITIISLLIVYSFYSSVFVFIGAAPFMLYLFITGSWQHKKSLTLIFSLSLVFALPILWIYLSKVGPEVESGFQFLPFTSYFPGSLAGQWWGKLVDLTNAGVVIVGLCGFFPFLLCLLGELLVPCFLLIMAGASGIKMSTRDVQLLLLSSLFLLSIYFISFSGANNYAMRGAIIPLFIIYYLAAQYGSEINLHDKIRIILLVVLALGSINEVGANFRQLINPIKPSAAARPFLKNIYRLNADRHISRLSRAEVIAQVPIDDEGLFYYYLVEKLLDKKQPLLREDLELVSDGPFGPWKYQDWQKQ